MQKSSTKVESAEYGFFNAFFDTLGFKGAMDGIKSIFGLKSLLFVSVQTLAAVFSVFVGFVEKWVWDPPLGAGIIAFLIVADFVLGFLVAKQVRKESFDIKKAYRFVPVFLAHVGILALAHNLGKVEPTLVWLPNATFGWFSMRNFISVYNDLVTLKFLKGDFLAYLRGRAGAAGQEDLFKPKNNAIPETPENEPVKP